MYKKAAGLHPDVTIGGSCSECGLVFSLTESWHKAVDSGQHLVPKEWEIIKHKAYCPKCKEKYHGKS